MINASATTPSASAPTPKVNPFQPVAVGTPAGGDAGPKPFTPPSTTAFTPPPKKKMGLPMLAGLVAFLLISVGIAFGGYMVMTGGFDVRQQADIDVPDLPGCLGTQIDAASVCGGNAGSCTNSCRCGYSAGACGSKGIGEGCYTSAQCSSGICEGGTSGSNGHLGTCRPSNTSGSCLAGWVPTSQSLPACNATQGVATATQNNTQCHRCLEKEGIQGGQTCSAQQGCICQSGSQIGQSVNNGGTCAGTTAGCWYINVPPAQSGAQPNCVYANDCTGRAPGTTFVAESTCTQALQSGAIPSPSTGVGGLPICTSQQLSGPLVYSEASLTRGDNTQGTCSASGVVMYSCISGYSFIESAGKHACVSNSYSAAKRSCIAGPFGAVEEFYTTAVRACESNPNNFWSDTSCTCSSKGRLGDTCFNDIQCISGTCDLSLIQSTGGNGGRCTGSDAQVGPCCVKENNKLVYKSLCSAADRVSIPNGSSCSNTGSGVTPNPGSLNQCPNPNSGTVAQWITFTCDKCTITTEGGVTAPRCYDKPVISTTYPGPLDPTVCGQIDAINTQGNYCGYYTSDYTCGNPNCLPTSTPPPSTPPTQVSCGQMQVLDSTGSTVLTSTPNVGDQVRFRCVAAGGVQADYFFFTLRDNPLSALNLIYQGTSDLTFPITITPFTHAQCNPCVGTTCSSGDSVNQNCNFQFGSTPTPTPPVGPQCLSITLNNASRPTAGTSDPRIGETISFSCGEVVGADHYEFRVSLPDGTTQNLNATGRNSSSITITSPGMYAAQCRICTSPDAASCQEYEALPDTSAS